MLPVVSWWSKKTNHFLLIYEKNLRLVDFFPNQPRQEAY